MDTSSQQRLEERYHLRWIVTVVVLAAGLVDILDATIVNVAAPSIRRDLGGGYSAIQWLSAGYTLAFAVLLIAGARLGDIFGRRSLFLIGSAGFTLWSSACSVAPNMDMLIAFRVLQGAFGALMIPQAFPLLKQAFNDDTEFAKANALFGPTAGFAMLGAPIIAGGLVGANLWGTGWRLVFLINLPIGAVTLPLAIRSLPRGASHPDVRLDVGGAVLIGLALAAITYPLIQGGPAGWPAWSFGLIAIGVILIAVFLFYERRRKNNALIEPTVLANGTYLSGVATLVAISGAFSGLILCISLYGQLGEGWSPIHAGLALTPMVVGMLLGTFGSRAVAKRLGRHRLHVGIVLVALGVVAIAVIRTGTSVASTWDIVPGLLLVGAGMGATTGQLFVIILSSVSMNELGSASGVLEAAQQLASALGVAVIGTIFFSVFDHHLPSEALRTTAWACLVPVSAAFVLVFRLPMRSPGE